jgi:glutathione S-transferase
LSPVCSAIKRDGTRCTQSVGPGEHYCHHHAPARAEERRRNAAKAGRSRPSSEIRGVKTQLQELTDRLLCGEVERADAAVCGQLLNVKLRALELERRWREIEELEARLEAVEGVLKGREKRTSA